MNVLDRFNSNTPDGISEDIVFKIMRNLEDRSGIGNAIEECDDDVKKEMIEDLVGITDKVLDDNE